MAPSRSASSLASVDFPAAMLPHKNINFVEVLMSCLSAYGVRSAFTGSTVLARRAGM